MDTRFDEISSEVKIKAWWGPYEEGDKEIMILGRVVRWREDRVEYTGIPKHMGRCWSIFELAGRQGL